MGRGDADAFEAALGSIGRRERTTEEIINWLAERDYGPEEIEAAVGRLIEEGLLDDERFAELFAQDKRELTGWGPERIALALAERGIARHQIDAVCAEGHDSQVERAAAQLVERGGVSADDRWRERSLGFLTRRGYGYEVAHDAIRAVGDGSGARAV